MQQPDARGAAKDSHQVAEVGSVTSMEEGLT